MEGCLTHEGRKFSVGDVWTGKMYQLHGDEATLSKFVDHEVSVTGVYSDAKATSTEDEIHSNDSLSSSIDVVSMKKISDQCGAPKSH